MENQSEYKTAIFAVQKLLLGAIPILRQHIFGLFGPYPPYQHKYSTERQQKGPFSRPTYPVLFQT